MSDSLAHETPAPPAESKLGSMSIRALVTLLLVGSVCLIGVLNAAYAVMSKGDVMVLEPLATLAGIAVGYYFGQKNQPPKTP